MKTNGPVICVEDLRLAEHRRLPLSASAGKKQKQEWRQQQWRESEANGWGRNRRAGKGVAGDRPGGEGAAVRFHRRTLRLIYGRTPRIATLKGGGHWGGDGEVGNRGIRIGTSDRFGRAEANY